MGLLSVIANTMKLEHSAVQKNPFRIEKMSATAVIDEARRIIALAGGERTWNDTRKSWLARAARRLGIQYGRAVTLFYRKAKDMPASEYLMLRDKARELLEEQRRRESHLDELALQISALAEPIADEAVWSPSDVGAPDRKSGS